jgi:hypothetical protein
MWITHPESEPGLDEIDYGPGKVVPDVLYLAALDARSAVIGVSICRGM